MRGRSVSGVLLVSRHQWGYRSPRLGNTTFTPSYTTTFTDYLGDKYSGTEVITLAFSTPILSSDTFSLTLNRGPLLLDGINYYNNHVVGYGCDAPATNCFLDNVNDFKNSAYTPNLEPWIMLSEVQFTAAVPEPSTWIMMLLGFAGLGFGMYRRNASACQQWHDLISAQQPKTMKATERWLLFWIAKLAELFGLIRAFHIH